MSRAQELATAAATRTGRIALLSAPRRMDIVTAAVEEPGPGQVLVRLAGCGVCGSNLPVWEGREWFEYPQPPGAPGHEGWGVVEATGPSVTDVRTGDRVACLSGNAFAEFDVAAARAVVKLPEELGEMPFPGEAMGCAMNVFRRSAVAAGDTVAIVGVGFLGALLTQLASQAGARVIAVSRRPYALEVARRCGAVETVAMAEDGAVIETIRELTDGRMCDVVMEVVGLQRALDVAGELTRERGRLVIAGFHQDGPRQVNMFLWNWRGLDVINAHERDPAVYVQGMEAAVSAVMTGVLNPASLYTHEFPLDRAGDALDVMRTRPHGFLKALVRT